MENKNDTVLVVPEPKIETRFGVGSDRTFQSTRALKWGAGITVIGLVIAFSIQSPDQPLDVHEGVKAPEVSDLNQSEAIHLEQYSPVKESAQIKQNQKPAKIPAVIRLPGLQKIDRRSDYTVPPGSTVKAVLLTGASNGAVRAEIRESIQVQGETIIPEGAKLLGTGQSGEDRLLVHFTQVIFKDGTSTETSAQAADIEDKIVGLHGSRIGSYAVKYAAAIGLNFVGAMSESLQDRQAVGQQVINTPNAKNALLHGTSQATLEMANGTMNDLKTKPPVIEVRAGKEILVIFE